MLSNVRHEQTSNLSHIITTLTHHRGFTYYTTLTTINFFTSSSVIFAGCISTYPASSRPTTIPARSGNTDLGTTTVKGPITMWAQPISVEFYKDELSLFTTTAATPSSIRVVQSFSPPTASTQPPSQPQPTRKLSGAAGAGVGVGAALGFLIIALAVFFFFRRHRIAKRENKRTEALDYTIPELHATTSHKFLPSAAEPTSPQELQA